MASIVMVDNETQSKSSRITKEGKKITYAMKVIQQPERARACGSGAKSSADRRPVDPPPIVELRVFEGDAMTDITFSYSANFFLFATLENARTVAQGRVTPAPHSFPVLTGTPVAGMAYLDRPMQAGYFIFPDLSVRHEGKYRLSFALYEELKESKDMDPDEPAPEGPNPHMQAHVTHRLEVKSAPFTVFSAKKFPGLTESTALSRMVAEQGCRVRIRRDVRMRRRDNKAGKDWDEYEDEAAYERRRTATPDAYNQSLSTPQPLMDGGDRPRSVSNASNSSFQMAPQRRPSLQDISPGYQQSYQNHMPAPQPQQNGYSPMPYVNNQQPQQYQGQYAQPPQPMMQPPHTQYQAPHPGYPAQPPLQAPQQYNYQSYSQPTYEQAPVRHEGMEYPTTPSDYRRTAAPPQSQGSQYHSSNQMGTPYSSMDPYNRSGQSNHAVQPLQPSLAPQHAPPTPTSSHGMNGHSLAPIKSIHPVVEKHEPVSPSYGMSGPIPAAEPIQAQSYSDQSRASLPKFASAPSPATGSKRSFSSTFGSQHTEQPLRQGARPGVTHGPEDFSSQFDDGNDDDGLADRASMSYRRADGTQRSRRVPLSR